MKDLPSKSLDISFPFVRTWVKRQEALILNCTGRAADIKLALPASRVSRHFRPSREGQGLICLIWSNTILPQNWHYRRVRVRVAESPLVVLKLVQNRQIH